MDTIPKKAADKIKERELQQAHDLETIQKGTETVNAILAKMNGGKTPEAETVVPPSVIEDTTEQKSSTEEKKTKQAIKDTTENKTTTGKRTRAQGIKANINEEISKEETTPKIPLIKKTKGKATKVKEGSSIKSPNTTTEEDLKRKINEQLNQVSLENEVAVEQKDGDDEQIEIHKPDEQNEDKEGELTEEEQGMLNKLIESTDQLEARLLELLAEKEKLSQDEDKEEDDGEVNKESKKFLIKLNNAKDELEKKVNQITWYKPLVSVKDSAFLVCDTYTDSSLYKGSALHTKKALEETIKEINSSIKYTEKTIAEEKLQLKKDKEEFIRQEEEKRIKKEKEEEEERIAVEKEKAEITKDRAEKPFLYYAVENSNNSYILNAYAKKSFTDLRTIEGDSAMGRSYQFLKKINENEGYFDINLYGFVKVIKNVPEIKTTEGKIGIYANNAMYKILGPNNEIVADDIQGHEEADKIYYKKITEYKAKLLEQFEKDSESKE
jgi:hypothetical protein